MEDRREERKIVVQRYSTTELAPLLGRSPRGLRREIAKVKHRYGPREGQKWSPDQLRMILDDFAVKYRIVLMDEAA